MTLDVERRLAEYRDTLEAAISADLALREMQPIRPHRPSRGRLTLVASMIGVMLVAVVAAVALRSEDDTTLTSSSTPDERGGSSPVDSSAQATTVSIQEEPLARELVVGSAGTDVGRLEQRLFELGFDPGVVDEEFDSTTERAVWAFEKLVVGVPRDEVTGVVTPQLWQRMLDDVQIQPRRPELDANHTEIYLPEQILVVFHGDTPVLISHISTGDGKEWCEHVTIDPGTLGNNDGDIPIERDVCGQSVTPGGVFTYNSSHEGPLDTELGALWDPVFFNYGLAVHGAEDVPATPSSHGTIRIPRHTAKRHHDLVAIGDRVYIWDGNQEPEDLGNPVPMFVVLDPRAAPTGGRSGP